MVNILGPGLTGDNATSSRPTHQNTGSGIDLWFKDCTSDEAQDGTSIRAQWLNMVMAQIREAIRGMGVPDDEDDDTMLLQCFQKLQFTNWLNLPIQPEVLVSGNVLSVTNAGGGSLLVAAGQEFLHRGWNKVATNDYSSGARTVATSANKTYHLRWQYNSGSPLFVLKDVADGVYNPGSASERSSAFDSTYDDMLICRVVTDGANSPTILGLKNKAVLVDNSTWYDYPLDYNNEANRAGSLYSFSLNWARTPQINVHMRAQANVGLHDAYGGYGDHDAYITGGDALNHTLFSSIDIAYSNIAHTPYWDRYQVSGFAQADYAELIALQLAARAWQEDCTMRLIIKDDLVLGASEGDGVGGVEWPEKMRALPVSHMRFADNKIVDVSKSKKFFVDEVGRKHIVPGPGRQELDCTVDEPIVKDGNTWRVKSDGEKIAPQIKLEAANRIRAEIDIYAQMNALGAAVKALRKTASQRTAEDKAVIDDVAKMHDWIDAMRGSVRSMKDKGDKGYASNAKWPKAPASVKRIKDKF